MPHTSHSHVTNVLWSAKPVSKVNTKTWAYFVSSLSKGIFLLVVLFFLYIGFEGKFYIWQIKWTLGQQLIVSITSLLDMHPPCFPIGQQGLRILAQIPKDWVWQKSWRTCVTQGSGHQRQGQGWGRICLSRCFPDPLDGLITLILKAAKLTFLRNTQLIVSQFWIAGHFTTVVCASESRSQDWQGDSHPDCSARVTCPLWKPCVFNRRPFSAESSASQANALIITLNDENCLFCEHNGFLCLQFSSS